jgi:hypothetical protein
MVIPQRVMAGSGVSAHPVRRSVNHSSPSVLHSLLLFTLYRSHYHLLRNSEWICIHDIGGQCIGSSVVVCGVGTHLLLLLPWKAQA